MKSCVAVFPVRLTVTYHQFSNVWSDGGCSELRRSAASLIQTCPSKMLFSSTSAWFLSKQVSGGGGGGRVSDSSSICHVGSFAATTAWQDQCCALVGLCSLLWGIYNKHVSGSSFYIFTSHSYLVSICLAAQLNRSHLHISLRGSAYEATETKRNFASFHFFFLSAENNAHPQMFQTNMLMFCVLIHKSLLDLDPGFSWSFS